ncbi:MAG: cobyrinate a,c-diamide synthase [Candidatus Methylomirabilales bacterium]
MSDRVSAPCPRLAIGALRGSSGKTVLAMGLIQAWTAQGRIVAPFKKGPDYIDAAWLTRAGGRACRNIDTYLMGEEVILRSVGEHARAADVTVIEGNHGLYDGLGAGAAASTAEVAKLVRAPLVLLADCTKTTRTVAAMILGCRHMDPGLAIAGVVLNQVATARQEAAIRAAVEQVTGLPVVGCIPRLPDLRLPERHLGLLTPAEHPEAQSPIRLARQAVEAHVDLDAVWSLAQRAAPLQWVPEAPAAAPNGIRVGVIRDRAFTFYYPENLEALERLGARLVEVSALTAPALPPLDALYIGGGYPETHAAALAANAGFRASLRAAIEAGLPVVAECGGLIYLSDAMLLDGAAHPLVGIFPVTFELGRRPWGHGYTALTVEGANPFFPAGAALRGHEFRYSSVKEMRADALRLAFRMQRGRGFDGERDGLVYKNVLASFTHFHALSAPDWAGALMREARRHHGRQARAAAEPAAAATPPAAGVPGGRA